MWSNISLCLESLTINSYKNNLDIFIKYVKQHPKLAKLILKNTQEYMKYYLLDQTDKIISILVSIIRNLNIYKKEYVIDTKYYRKTTSLERLYQEDVIQRIKYSENEIMFHSILYTENKSVWML